MLRDIVVLIGYGVSTSYKLVGDVNHLDNTHFIEAAKVLQTKSRLEYQLLKHNNNKHLLHEETENAKTNNDKVNSGENKLNVMKQSCPAQYEILRIMPGHEKLDIVWKDKKKNHITG